MFLNKRQPNNLLFCFYNVINGTYFINLLMGLPLASMFIMYIIMLKRIICEVPINFINQKGFSLIKKSEKNKLITKLFGGNLLLYLTCNIVMHLYQNKYLFPRLEQGESIKTLLIFCYIISSILLIICQIINPGKLNNQQSKTQIMQKYQLRPEIQKPTFICQDCQIPRIMRSQHCSICQSCISKSTGHSFIINTCIGARNQLIYIIFLFFYWLTVNISCYAFFLSKNNVEIEYSKSLNIFFLIVSYILACKINQVFLEQLLFLMYNITKYEMEKYSNLPYLWRSKNADFFNPFDKGYLNNMRESLEPLVQSSKKFNDIELEDIENLQKKKTVQQQTYINWETNIYFTVMDVENSPMRAYLINKIQNGDIQLPGYEKNEDKIKLKQVDKNYPVQKDDIDNIEDSPLLNKQSSDNNPFK